MESTSLKLETASKKEKLFIKVHKQANAKKAIICLHGGTEYHSAFNNLKDYTDKNKENYCLLCPDLRGHGLSSRPRNYINDFDDYINDLKIIIEAIDKDFDEIYLWGHSISAIIAMKFVTEYSDLAQGIIISNPPIKLENKWSSVFDDYAGVLTEGAPHIRLPTMTKGKDLYSDREFAKVYDSDPLIGTYLSVKLCLELSKAAKELVKNCYFFEHPALFLLSGKDHLVDQEVTKVFIKSIPYPKIMVKEYKTAKHGIHNDKKSPAIFKDIYEWIERKDD